MALSANDEFMTNLATAEWNTVPDTDNPGVGTTWTTTIDEVAHVAWCDVSEDNLTVKYALAREDDTGANPQPAKHHFHSDVNPIPIFFHGGGRHGVASEQRRRGRRRQDDSRQPRHPRQ